MFAGISSTHELIISDQYHVCQFKSESFFSDIVFHLHWIRIIPNMYYIFSSFLNFFKQNYGPFFRTLIKNYEKKTFGITFIREHHSLKNNNNKMLEYCFMKMWMYLHLPIFVHWIISFGGVHISCQYFSAPSFYFSIVKVSNSSHFSWDCCCCCFRHCSFFSGAAFIRKKRKMLLIYQYLWKLRCHFFPAHLNSTKFLSFVLICAQKVHSLSNRICASLENMISRYRHTITSKNSMPL